MIVPEGSIFGLIGPNGSGKTTTMRLILRIYQPDEGSVQVLGEFDGTSADSRVGYLPEERGLYRRMTVEGVLKYFARLKGVRRPANVIDQHLQRLDAIAWKTKKIEQLSKGMAQKIQFIVAMIAQPSLVILDEPFSGLDPVNLNLMRDLVLELRQKGTTVIFSTHDMEVAQQMCDHVFMIYEGKRVLDGTIGSIRETHGGPCVRVRMASGFDLSDHMDDLHSASRQDGFVDFTLGSEAERSALLRRLLELGDVEHFETVRPSLHDIFVQIVQPDEREPVDTTARIGGEV